MVDTKKKNTEKIDFESFQQTYTLFLKNYTSSLNEMIETNNRFLINKNDEINKILKINHVLFTGSQASQDSNDNDSARKTPDDAVQLPGNLSTAFQLTEELFKEASKQLEELNKKNNEILNENASRFQNP
nr:hypothetical protein [uncultured Desulfobacter sp.]